MRDDTTFVGLDVHKREIVAAMLLPEGELRELRCGHDERGVKRLVRWITRESEGDAACCYEAGPCGFGLQRKLQQEGIECVVVAPSLVPRRPGDRIKTDRRDARKLASLHRSDLLTEVHPPTEEEEALRDLCRCREDARGMQHRARQQLLKFLDRRGFRWSKGRWTQKHWAWLRSLEFADGFSRRVFDDYLLAVQQCDGRVAELDRALHSAGETEMCRDAVSALRCFRGIDTVTAVMLVGELYGFGRFGSPRGLMAYLGLVPSEDSSGDRECRGALTKAGNRHVRRLLVEASWHYRHPPRVGENLRRRRIGQDVDVIAHADRAMVRLHRRYWQLVNRGKMPQKASVAVARELVGFIWAALLPESGRA